MKPSPFTAKQKLSRAAAKKKAIRDKKAAMTKKRRDRKAENQRIGQNSTTDLHHKKDGSVVRMSKKNNRNVWKHGER